MRRARAGIGRRPIAVSDKELERFRARRKRSNARRPRSASGRCRASPGSIAYSGCHCTPMNQRCVGSSMPSITPSGARALTVRPGAASATAWWCALFTCHGHRCRRCCGAVGCRRSSVTACPGSVRGIGLLVGERVRHRVRNVLDEGAAERDVHELLAAADAERGHRPDRCAARVMVSSKAVRRSLVVTVSCREAAPKRAGSTSKAPPVMTRPSTRFRDSAPRAPARAAARPECRPPPRSPCSSFRGSRTTARRNSRRAARYRG